MVLVFHFDFPANPFFFFLEGSLHIAWKILCSLGISRKGDMPSLFCFDGYVPLSSAWFRGLGPESFTRM